MASQGLQALRARLRYGLSVDELRTYRLENATDSELARYLPREHWKKVVLQRLNEAEGWRPLFDNKMLFATYFGGQGLRVPQVFGIYHPDWGFWSSGGRRSPIRTLEDLEAVSASLPDRWVLKPVGGRQAQDVTIVGRDPARSGNLLGQNGQPLSRSEVNSAALRVSGGVSGLLIQEFVPPSEWAMRLNGTGACTLRLITYRRASGQVLLQWAHLGLSSPGTLIANPSIGSISVRVDPDSGELGRGRAKAPDSQWVSRHPSGSVAFSGEQIPYWTRTRELILSAASLTPQFRSVGWDLLIGPDGPQLLEGNWKWVPSFQIHGGIHELGISRAWLDDTVVLPQDIRPSVVTNARSALRSSRGRVRIRFGRVKER